MKRFINTLLISLISLSCLTLQGQDKKITSPTKPNKTITSTQVTKSKVPGVKKQTAPKQYSQPIKKIPGQKGVSQFPGRKQNGSSYDYEDDVNAQAKEEVNEAIEQAKEVVKDAKEQGKEIVRGAKEAAKAILEK